MNARPPADALRLFNEMAEELRDSRFTQALNKGIVGTSLRMRAGEPVEIARARTSNPSGRSS